ncbi:MAG: hypothetical protein ACMVO3_09765 [Thalassobaculum sp.]
MYTLRLLEILRKIIEDSSAKAYAMRLRFHFPQLKNEKDIYVFLKDVGDIVEGAEKEISDKSNMSLSTQKDLLGIVGKCRVLYQLKNVGVQFDKVLGEAPTAAEVGTLAVFADMSGMEREQVALSEDEISELAGKLSSIIDDVNGSMLDEIVKYHVVIRLSSLLSAIYSFKYLGEEVFWREIGSVSSLLWRKQEELTEGEEVEGSLLGKISGFVKSAANTVSDAERTVKGTINISKMMEMLPSGTAGQ